MPHLRRHSRPRGAAATVTDADRFADTLSQELAQSGFEAVRVKKLDLKPIPAVCVLGQAATTTTQSAHALAAVDMDKALTEAGSAAQPCNATG
jgi:hypothetical protein